MAVKPVNITAACLLGLFMIRLLVSFSSYFVIDHHHKLQHEKMRSAKIRYTLLRLTKRELAESCLPGRNEILWRGCYYDVKAIEIKGNTCYVKALCDIKESLVKKNAHKPLPKNTAAYKLSLLKYIAGKEIQYIFFAAADACLYLPSVMHKYTNPFGMIATPPPDFC